MGEIRTQKPAEERREITQEALKIRAGVSNYSTYSELAREHGISRQAVDEYLKNVTSDPWGRLDEAEKEVDFRLNVLELLGEDVEDYYE
jgi:transposase-like protein